MHFLILGASGRTGNLVLAEALAQNHTITALARNPSSIPETPNVTVIKGTPSSADDLKKVFTTGPKIDVVLITLSSSRASDSPFAASTSPPNFLKNTISTVTQAMLKYDVKRIIYMSAFGVGTSNPSLILPMRLLINNSTMGKIGFVDHANAENVIRESGLEYGIVRSAMLKEGEKKGVKEFIECGKGIGSWPGCTRKSVAGFMVGLAGRGGEEKEKEKWESRVVVICN